MMTLLGRTMIRKKHNQMAAQPMTKEDLLSKILTGTLEAGDILTALLAGVITKDEVTAMYAHVRIEPSKSVQKVEGKIEENVEAKACTCEREHLRFHSTIKGWIILSPEGIKPELLTMMMAIGEYSNEALAALEFNGVDTKAILERAERENKYPVRILIFESSTKFQKILWRNDDNRFAAIAKDSPICLDATDMSNLNISCKCGWEINISTKSEKYL